MSPAARRALRASALVLGLLVLSAGCESLIGLEDRHLVDAGLSSEPTAVSKRTPVDAPSAAECDAYCGRMLGANGELAACPSAYRSADACRAACATMARGTPGDDPLDPSAGDYNTLACRVHHAQQAARDPSKAAAACLAAGPSGEGTPGCGTACENYCTLFATACPDDKHAADVATCVERCPAVRNHRRFDAAGGIDLSGNSVQCRLVHTMNALAYAASGGPAPNPHCAHAALKSSNCVDAPSDPGYCDSYCTLTSTACKGKQQLYESGAQCLAACRALAPGEPTDKASGNTVACRTYHGINSLLGNDAHCGHAGPGGGEARACGDECTSYCRLAAAACGERFTATFRDADPQAACRSTCGSLAGAAPPAPYMGYTLATGRDAQGKGDSLPCRLYFTAKALEDPTTAAQHCPSALGGERCK